MYVTGINENTANFLSTFSAEAHLNKNSARALKKTQHFSITKILFRIIIAVCSENRMKPIAELLVAKAGGTYSYHWDLKG
jgi:hypothetical protein